MLEINQQQLEFIEHNLGLRRMLLNEDGYVDFTKKEAWEEIANSTLFELGERFRKLHLTEVIDPVNEPIPSGGIMLPEILSDFRQKITLSELCFCTVTVTTDGGYYAHRTKLFALYDDDTPYFLSLLEDFQTYVREVMVKKIQIQEDKDYELFKQLKARFEPSGEKNESGIS